MTPADVKAKQESSESKKDADSKTESKKKAAKEGDDLMGLPVEPTGLEGAAFQSRVSLFLIITHFLVSQLSLK